MEQFGSRLLLSLEAEIQLYGEVARQEAGLSLQWWNWLKEVERQRQQALARPLAEGQLERPGAQP